MVYRRSQIALHLLFSSSDQRKPQTVRLYLECLKVDSHILCRSHAVPMPCHSAKALDCVFPIWLTQCGRVWFTHIMPFPCRSPAMPRICLSENDLLRPWQVRSRVTAWERHSICQLASAVKRRHVGDFQAFGLLLLPRPVPASLLSEAYQPQMRVASVKKSNVCDARGEAYYFGARTWVLV
jgi:hypothetical protein